MGSLGVIPLTHTTRETLNKLKVNNQIQRTWEQKCMSRNLPEMSIGSFYPAQDVWLSIKNYKTH